MPRVSVIIPTYNRVHYLAAAIRSVLNQTFQDFEIIVVDDFSNDNPRNVVDSFADQRIWYLRHEENKGEAAARNTGIKNSTGSYIAFLDDDDEWMPEKLQSQVDILDHASSEVGVVYTGYDSIDEEERVVARRLPAGNGRLYKQMLFRNLIGAASTVCVKRDCLNSVGLFDETIAYGVDHDLWLRIARQYEFKYVSQPLVKYRIHPDRLSNNLNLMIQGHEDRIRKYGEEYSKHRRLYSRRLLSLGGLSFYARNLEKGRKFLLESIKRNPLNLRAYLYWLLSIQGTDGFIKFMQFKKCRTKTTGSFVPGEIIE